MIVTAVGGNSIYGKMMETMQDENEFETPLQTKLNVLVKIISYIGIGVALLTVIVLIIRFFVDK